MSSRAVEVMPSAPQGRQRGQNDQLQRNQNDVNCNSSFRSHRLLGHWVHVDPDSNPGCIAVSFTHREGILTVARYGEHFSEHPKSIAIAHATPTRNGCWLKDRYTTLTLLPDGKLELLEDHHEEREPRSRSPSGHVQESAAFLPSDRMIFERFDGDLLDLLAHPQVSPSVGVKPSNPMGGSLTEDGSCALSVMAEDDEHSKFFNSCHQSRPNRNVHVRSSFDICVGVYMLLSSTTGACVLFHQGRHNWPFHLFWVLASATLAATQLCQRITTEIGDHLIEAYMIFVGSVSAKARIFSGDGISSGSVTVQFGGILHRIGGRPTVVLAVLLVASNYVTLTHLVRVWLNNLGLSDDTGLHEIGMDWCGKFHFAPLPFMYLLAKLVLGSVFQDFFFSAKDKNLHERLEEGLQWKGCCFFAWQMLSLILAYRQIFQLWSDEMKVLHLSSRVDEWAWVAFLLTQKGAVLSVFQLIAKLFVETNVEVDGTPPEVYHSLVVLLPCFLRHGRHSERQLKIPSFWQGGKAKLLWTAACFILPTVVCALPLIICACLYIIFVVTFPIWGPAVVALGMLLTDCDRIYEVVEFGAKAHVSLWGYWSLMIVLCASAIYTRAQIWKFEAMWCSKGRAPDGKVGYLTSATTILWTMLVVIFLQSYVAWGFLAVLFMKHTESKGGRQVLPEIPWLEFNLRQLRQYNHCVYDLAGNQITKGHFLIEIMGWT